MNFFFVLDFGTAVFNVEKIPIIDNAFVFRIKPIANDSIELEDAEMRKGRVVC